jgi:phage portal protein BeeE
MGVKDSLVRWWNPQAVEERADLPISLDDWANMFQFGGVPYMVQGGTPGQNGERIESSFQGYVSGAYKANGVVFACMKARMSVFSEARMQFRRVTNGRPGDLFGTADLGILERPWPGATTGDLMTRALVDVDLAGNFYACRRGNEIKRLRPDWVTIITGSRTGMEIDTELLGYMYQPAGPYSGEDPVFLLPEQVAHFVDQPDPVARYRGMSWLTPIVDELVADKAATAHKRNFFENGAKLGYVVTLDKDVVKNVDQFTQWVDKFKQGHEGAWNAYKTLFLAGGADVKVVGANLQELDFSNVQAGGELRVCAAAGAGLNLIIGLGGPPTYANFAQARRAFADVTIRPLWRKFVGSMARIVNVPSGADLWYDDRDIPFLQEDQQDAATIQQTQAITIRELINSGYEPGSVVKAVMAGDFSLLSHSGLVSVQLQPPGTTAPSPASSNGAAPAALLNGNP